MLSLTIVAALAAVGIVLVVAMLVGPGAIAFLLCKRFGPMMLVATAISVTCSLLGIYLSFFINSAPAPTIVLLLTAGFVASFVWTTRRPAPLAA
jgi:manganese/iron transport system permease protein